MLKRLNFKDEFVLFWGVGEEAGRRIAEAAVLEAFREGKVSSGKAAELLGMTRQEFLDILGERKIPVGNAPLQDADTLKKMLAGR